MHNNHAQGGQQQKHIADISAAEQHNISSTHIAAAPEQQRKSSGRSSSSLTSFTPEAAPGATVGAGKPGGARGGKAYY